MTISKRIKTFPLIVMAAVLLAGCLHPSANAVPGNVYLFAKYSSHWQATDTDRLSQAVAVSALVALEVRRKERRWPESEDVIASRVAILRPDAWLMDELSRIETARPLDANAITFVRKDTATVLATVYADGRMETPLASPLLKADSDGVVAQRRVPRGHLIGFLIEQLESPIVR